MDITIFIQSGCQNQSPEVIVKIKQNSAHNTQCHTSLGTYYEPGTLPLASIHRLILQKGSGKIPNIAETSVPMAKAAMVSVPRR